MQKKNPSIVNVFYKREKKLIMNSESNAYWTIYFLKKYWDNNILDRYE